MGYSVPKAPDHHGLQERLERDRSNALALHGSVPIHSCHSSTPVRHWPISSIALLRYYTSVSNVIELQTTMNTSISGNVQRTISEQEDPRYKDVIEEAERY